MNPKNWKQIHEHYMNVKKQYNLTSYDIYRQLGVYPLLSYIQFLHPQGFLRNPSGKEGTTGYKVTQLLSNGLNKTDWLPSNASYEEKLTEKLLDYNRRHILSVDFLKSVDKIPQLEVNLCMTEGPMLSVEQLQEMFTIDTTIPKIVKINKAYHLI
jgi:hypothetical protein